MKDGVFGIKNRTRDAAEVPMLGLVTVVGMCIAGIAFCIVFLVAVCLERRRYLVCYVVREKSEEMHPAVPRMRETIRAIGQAA
jgi:hypothetical protein